MPNGFGTVPEELRFTAAKIGNVISTIVGAQWQGPTGDYGHEGVQQGWATFVEQMKAHVEALRAKADGHGQGLVTAATSYQDREAGVSALFEQAAPTLDEPPTGFLHPSIGARLSPGGGTGPAPAPAPGRMVF